MKYNPELLKHEATHFEELQKKFPDLEIHFGGEEGSWYTSDLILPIANYMEIENNHGDFSGEYKADFFLKQAPCTICQDVNNKDSFFYINSFTTVRICHVDFNSLNISNQISTTAYEIHTFDYKDVFEQLNIPTSLLKEADLFVLKLIQEHPEIKVLRISSRLKRLIPLL